jgi:HD superfamily phosphohydrolase YqeK
MKEAHWEMNRLEIEKKLKKALDKERYTHTMGVMYTAASLAMRHGADMEQALYAGLLHVSPTARS